MTTLLEPILQAPGNAKNSALAFTVYSRTCCGCCDKAMNVLKEAQRRSDSSSTKSISITIRTWSRSTTPRSRS